MPADVAFWDTSAIIPLFCNQPISADSRRLRKRFIDTVVWWGTHVEVHSGISRLLREGRMSEGQSLAALEKWGRLYSTASIVSPSETVLNIAARLTAEYGIRALDAFQLAAAIVWCNERPRNRPFICADKRLSLAAKSAGFDVIEVG